jgi:hypothetical protein
MYARLQGAWGPDRFAEGMMNSETSSAAGPVTTNTFRQPSRNFDQRSFVSAASWPAVFISRTARCDAAYPSNVIVRGVDPV